MIQEKELKGKIFDIQGFSLQDGPGIRTTIFFKGCPLRCPWCHSPESQAFKSQLSFLAAKCVGTEACADACVKACPENAKIGEALASKWNQASVDMEVLLPLKGVSMIDADGQPFDGPEERAALYAALKKGITNPLVKITEMNNNINDAEFAEAAAKKLIELMKK